MFKIIHSVNYVNKMAVSTAFALFTELAIKMISTSHPEKVEKNTLDNVKKINHSRQVAELKQVAFELFKGDVLLLQVSSQ